MGYSQKEVSYIIKEKKGKEPKCKCGSVEIWAEGEGWHEVPVGFGGHGDGKFWVDKVRLYGWLGYCEGCRKYVFVYRRKRAVSKELKLAGGVK